MKIAVAGLVLGYLIGVNASWVSDAVRVSRLTGSPFLQVLDPLHRDWLK